MSIPPSTFHLTPDWGGGARGPGVWVVDGVVIAACDVSRTGFTWFHGWSRSPEPLLEAMSSNPFRYAFGTHNHHPFDGLDAFRCHLGLVRKLPGGQEAGFYSLSGLHDRGLLEGLVASGTTDGKIYRLDWPGREEGVETREVESELARWASLAVLASSLPGQPADTRNGTEEYLSEDQYLHILETGILRPHLHARGKALIGLLRTPTGSEGDNGTFDIVLAAYATLAPAADLFTGGLAPFDRWWRSDSGEVPGATAGLLSRHAVSLERADAVRRAVLIDLVRDSARIAFRQLRGRPRWSVLEAAGFPREEPAEPSK